MKPLHIERPHSVFEPSTIAAALLFWATLAAAVYFAVRS